MKAKLAATAAVTARVSARITPQLNTQEPAGERIVYQKIGADGQMNLSGNRKLKAHTVRVDCFAETEAAAVSLGLLVRNALAPESGAAWQDKTEGVHGCFFVDSAGDFTDDGERFQSETFTVWFKPTS